MGLAEFGGDERLDPTVERALLLDQMDRCFQENDFGLLINNQAGGVEAVLCGESPDFIGDEVLLVKELKADDGVRFWFSNRVVDEDYVFGDLSDVDASTATHDATVRAMLAKVTFTSWLSEARTQELAEDYPSIELTPEHIIDEAAEKYGAFMRFAIAREKRLRQASHLFVTCLLGEASQACAPLFSADSANDSVQ